MITTTRYGHRLTLLLLCSSLITVSPTRAVELSSAKIFCVSAGISAGIVGIGTLASMLKPVQRVGVVTIEGVMIESGKTVKELQLFFKDPSMKAIVLKINSGGGAPGTAQAIYHVVRELKKIYAKPVIAWVENVAASGAYYAACAADVIVASPSAIVGSVGVIKQIWQLKQALKHFDIEQEIITSGDYKATGNPWSEITPEQKAMYQEICDRTYKRFIQDVQQSRPSLAQRAVEEWANGRIFDAEYGLSLGMIDLLGSQVTIEQTVQNLTHDARAVELVYPPSIPAFLNYLDKQKLAVSTLVEALWHHLGQKIEQAENVPFKLG